jgi:hypothetical protein
MLIHLTDLYTGYWSPSHDNFCALRFLYKLLWSGDTECFHVLGFYLFLYHPNVLSPFHVIKSNHIATFALDQKSAYKGEYMIFGLLGLADLAQNDVL